MTSDDRRNRRMQHVTTTGSALAVALLPLAVGMLLARSVGADPMTSVNALIASGGQRARLSRCQLRAVRPMRDGRGMRVGGRAQRGRDASEGLGASEGRRVAEGLSARVGGLAQMGRKLALPSLPALRGR
ncbi:hypothetical protein ACFC0D_27405 [Streptomyces sp. NPDC056222]|uniref:hypothetical protein n=1 Tax=Streptomyces sp. NPDC056222 TaxID=3345749 RepID=UPI0035DE7F5F